MILNRNVRAATFEASASGAYMAIWRKVTGQWVIEAEMFVTLGAV